jgi:hypothetical protein
LFRGTGRAAGDPVAGAGTRTVHEETRRAIRSTLLGVGTLACRDCDAPVAIGEQPRMLTDQLTCPFCNRRGPARDFLSLTAPARPARVLVRMIIP